MTDGHLLLLENESIFSPIACMHYSYYDSLEAIKNEVAKNDSVQCIVGNGFLEFGKTQEPSLTDFADGLDTMKFLSSL
jgi:hypothetical protein